MSNTQFAQRLHEEVAAVCPITGVSIGTLGVSASVIIDFALAATGPQQTAAQNVVDAFDWSEAAQEAWHQPKRPTRIGSAVLDFGLILPLAHQDLVIPVPGAAPICGVTLSYPPDVFASGANMGRVHFTARMMVGFQVQVRCWNQHAALSANPASGLFRAICTNPILLGDL
jgi:hypothetical protein